MKRSITINGGRMISSSNNIHNRTFFINLFARTAIYPQISQITQISISRLSGNHPVKEL